MADAGQHAVLGLGEKGSLCPEMGKAAFPLRFRKEEVPHIAVPAKLDELHLRNLAESWADDANIGMDGDCCIIPRFMSPISYLYIANEVKKELRCCWEIGD